MDYGYLFFNINAVETSVYNDTIDHEIRISEGPQATIKNVNIAGNDKTKEYVIRRELRTVPGEKFSRQDLIRSQREIVNLGYFNQEKLGMQPVPNQDDGTVDINYTVEEKSSDQLELSAGWGGNIGLTGTLGITFNNFSIKNIFRKSSWDPLPTGDINPMVVSSDLPTSPLQSPGLEAKREILSLSISSIPSSPTPTIHSQDYSIEGMQTHPISAHRVLQ
jgi:outer membrane protein insertion porin family